MLRDSDATLSLDQRAAATNTSAPGCLPRHSRNQPGIRCALVCCATAGRYGESRSVSQIGARLKPALSKPLVSLEPARWTEMQKRKISVRTLSAPLRPLNNVMAPALAIELSPPSSTVLDVKLTRVPTADCGRAGRFLSHRGRRWRRNDDPAPLIDWRRRHAAGGDYDACLPAELKFRFQSLNRQRPICARSHLRHPAPRNTQRFMLHSTIQARFARPTRKSHFRRIASSAQRNCCER